ncbi:MAG: beta-Ala-His dipeptidase [Erysipelotrichaceae bacterium]|nr:beta-Ala-His dipeptidase [Erysipelotrichaceae bacterium]
MEFDLSKKHCYYFKAISDIPRGSRNEKAVSDYVVNFAKEHGYKYLQDEVYNVIVEKPASEGYENFEPVMLQAHMDMVCEKNKDVEHDFEKDPIDLYVDEEGHLRARGTTLGCDDGFGVAYMLAILDDRTLKHPPLQCIFTVMEEIGLFGAMALKKEYLHSKRLINLDSGSEDKTIVSSSGGARCVISRKLTYQPNESKTYTLQIRGLKGGHSAGTIHLELGNAILLGSRVLEELNEQFKDLRLVDINGGMKFNAIPREVDITFTTNTDTDELNKKAEETLNKIKSELQYSDPDFKGILTETAKADRALSTQDSKDIFEFLYVIPNGLQHRSMALDISVASLSAGVIYIKDDTLYLDDLIRSAEASHGDLMIRQLEILCPKFGFEFEMRDRYYGWAYSKDSGLREILRNVLKEKGVELKESATHGGLECGIFKGLIPDLDIITYAPISSGAHTVSEMLDLGSFDRTYENLCKVLENCR